MIHAGLLEDRRVYEHGVGHGEEGGEPGAQLRRHAGASGGETEIAVERACSPDASADACEPSPPRSSAILITLALSSPELRRHATVAWVAYPHARQQAR